MEEVSKKIGLSERHFKRRLKLAVGESPLQYVQGLRIFKPLISVSPTSITELIDEGTRLNRSVSVSNLGTGTLSYSIERAANFSRVEAGVYLVW